MRSLRKILLFIIISLFFNIHNVYAEGLPEKFDLREYVDIEIRNQEQTNTCWAFSASSLISMHLSYLQNENYLFSPRHMEYAMSENSIIGKENPYAYETKTLNIGGNPDVVKQYLVQGTGPVLEKNMPFKNNTEPINENEISLDLDYKQVTEASHILPVNKSWVNGELVYTDYVKAPMDENAVTEYQNSIKNAIKTYGGVDASISYSDNGFNLLNGSYNTKEIGEYWHAILLIGWDDNYSKDNFKDNVKPLNNGAYIAVNSWGSILGDKGYMYISYEDVSIDAMTKTYIKEVEDVDYDNVYFNDLTLAKQNEETLTEVSVVVSSKITGYTTLNLKIDGEYVLYKKEVNDCLENYVLEKPVKLNKDTETELEIMVNDEFKQYIYPYYYTVTNISQFESGNLDNNILDGSLNEIYLYTMHNAIDNNKQVDVKIYKDNEDLTSNFKITGNTIKNNQTGITISSKDAYNGKYTLKLVYDSKEICHTFTVINGKEYISNENLNEDNVDKENTDNDNANAGSTDKENTDNDNADVGNTDNENMGDASIDDESSDEGSTDEGNTDENTGLSGENTDSGNLNDKENGGKLKGDISLDGKVTVTDLSQLKAHIVNLIVLGKENVLACDINLDGKITMSDLSILKQILIGKY